MKPVRKAISTPRGEGTRGTTGDREQVWGQRLGRLLTILPWSPLTSNLVCTNEETPRGERPDGHSAEIPNRFAHTRSRTSRTHSRSQGRGECEPSSARSPHPPRCSASASGPVKTSDSHTALACEDVRRIPSGWDVLRGGVDGVHPWRARCRPAAETGSSPGDVLVPRHLKGEDKTDVPMSRNILRTECYVRSVRMVGNIMRTECYVPSGGPPRCCAFRRPAGGEPWCTCRHP